jgi:hypothetical protein
MPNRLFIADERMFKLMEWSVENGLVPTQSHFLDAIGFTRNNLTKVRKGLQGFRGEHILKACQFTGASADYIFGLTNEMKRKATRKPLDLLKEAVVAVEHELKKGRG